VANSAEMTSGVTDRYASALFELALFEKKVPAVEKDLQRFQKLLDGSEDLRRLVTSPVFSADEQFRAIDAVITKAKISGLVGNFIRVVAKNRRLFAMPGMLFAFRRMAAEHRGEVTAEVTVAKELNATQTRDLKAALKNSVGKDVTLEMKVDPSILGGMIVKVGSRQIDTSLRTRLSSLKLALKEAS